MTTIVIHGVPGGEPTEFTKILPSAWGCSRTIARWDGVSVTRDALHLCEKLPDVDLHEHFTKQGVIVYPYKSSYELNGPKAKREGKSGNPKDALGVSKWRTFTTIPMPVLAEVGAAFIEGHQKGYGRHNYRVGGATASVYIDGAMGHIMQWWEGEDNDPVTTLSHLSKAIANLMIIRDSMIQGVLKDDRPPKANLDPFRDELQASVDHIVAKFPDGCEPYTEQNKKLRGVTPVVTNQVKPDDLRMIVEADRINNGKSFAKAVFDTIAKVECNDTPTTPSARLGAFQHMKPSSAKRFPCGGVVKAPEKPFVFGERPGETLVSKEFAIKVERRAILEKAVARAKQELDEFLVGDVESGD